MKKNKKSKAAQQTQLLMQKAAIKKRFYVNLKEACRLMVGPDFYGKLTPHQLEDIYRYRFYSLNIKPAKGQHIPKPVMKEIMDFAPILLKNFTFPTAYENSQIDLLLYFEVGISLMLFGGYVKESEYPNAPYIKQQLAPYDINGEIYAEASSQMGTVLLLLGMMVSDLKSKMYWLDRDWTAATKGKSYNDIHVHEYAPEQITVSIEGNPRPVYRVFWVNPFQHVSYSSIKPSVLGLPDDGSDTPLDVYIQSHALHRMDERIGTYAGFTLFLLNRVFNNPQVHKEDEGKYLIEYYLHDKKIGYVVARIIEKKVVILTFLFLTSNGTPEGKKLAAITGLNKLDKKYLAIDKLNSFVTSDIKENEKIREVFIQAGCGSLFELEKKDIYFLDKSNGTNAALLLKYMNLSEASIVLTGAN